MGSARNWASGSGEFLSDFNMERVAIPARIWKFSFEGAAGYSPIANRLAFFAWMGLKAGCQLPQR